MIIKTIRNHLAITLSYTIQKLGPMPNDIGERFKVHMKSDDSFVLIILGTGLQNSQEKGDYEPLRQIMDAALQEED